MNRHPMKPHWEIADADPGFEGRFVDSAGTTIATTRATLERHATTLAVELVLGHRLIVSPDGFTWAPWSGDPGALIQVIDVTTPKRHPNGVVE